MSALMGEFDFHGDTRAMWDALAQQRGIKLPFWRARTTFGGITKWLRYLGISGEEFKEWAGVGASRYPALNPTWPLRATVGLLLEAFPDKQPSGMPPRGRL